MNCPLCLDTVLDVTHRGGIEVDICPRCRGVWLDRGELERLAASPLPGPGAPAAPMPSTAPPEGGPGHGSGPAADRAQPASKGRKDRKRRLADRLGDVLDEVLDL